MLQKWSWDGHALAACAWSVFSLELILLTIHILCSVTFGSYGVCSCRKFDESCYEKCHLIHDSVCTSSILMVGPITGTF